MTVSAAILAALDELELRDNTFVFFTSDNGPAITGDASTRFGRTAA